MKSGEAIGYDPWIIGSGAVVWSRFVLFDLDSADRARSPDLPNTFGPWNATRNSVAGLPDEKSVVVANVLRSAGQGRERLFDSVQALELSLASGRSQTLATLDARPGTPFEAVETSGKGEVRLRLDGMWRAYSQTSAGWKEVPPWSSSSESSS